MKQIIRQIKYYAFLFVLVAPLCAQNTNFEKFEKLKNSENITAISEQTLKILPLGNSITQSKIPHFSYRYNLWKELIDSGIKFDFVGSLDSNFQGKPSWPDYRGFQFDSDNEGHWGWRADELLDSLPVWLTGYTPNIVLMHVGSNDCNQNNSTLSTVQEITQIINLLRADNSEVSILLAKLIPWDNTTINSRINDLNSKFDSLATNLNTESSKIIVVDQNTGLDAVNDTFDGVHPNESGEEKMASVWFSGIKTALAKLSVKVFIQGVYISSNNMSDSLSNESFFPTENPFTISPWNYSGTEKVTSIPADVVDWVMLSIRNDISEESTFSRRAAFINSNGDIVDLDGVSPVSIFAQKNNYYIVVEHRNHLKVMSDNKILIE